MDMEVLVVEKISTNQGLMGLDHQAWLVFQRL